MNTPPSPQPLDDQSPDNWKYVTPTVAGVLGAAQLSMACFIARPEKTTDFLITGAVSVDMLWSIPLGALLGTALGWLFLRKYGRPSTWLERRKTWYYAMIAAVFVVPLAPGFIGLNPQTKAQMWQSLAMLLVITWVLLFTFMLMEQLNRQEPRQG